jgi:hypothetical protein
MDCPRRGPTRERCVETDEPPPSNPCNEELDKDTDAGAATAEGELIPVRKSNRDTQVSYARKKKNLE